MIAAFLLTTVYTAHLQLVSPGAKNVLFAGDLTGWSQNKPMTRTGTTWSIDLPVTLDTRFEYQFVVDGKWMLDPTNPNHIDNGVGSENSVWEGPRYKLHALDGEPKHPLTRRMITVDSRKVVIYTPPRPKGLPLIVYADGDTYEFKGHVQNVVENLVEAGRISSVVIALITPRDRMKEYGPDWKTYGDFLLGDVVPKVREATGASVRPADLYLGGSSMGGVIALRLAEEYPDQVAGGLHVQSGAFQYDPLSLDYNVIIKPEALAKLDPRLKLWMDWGRYEDGLTSANETLMAELRREHRAFGHVVTAEGHNWTAWRNRMVAGLVYLVGH